MNEKILDIIHKTIYQFFDVCGDDEEVPMSDKDKLLLEVNKAICNNLKALKEEQETQTGHWLFYGRLLKCSNCGSINDDMLDICPNCGAKMEREE